MQDIVSQWGCPPLSLNVTLVRGAQFRVNSSLAPCPPVEKQDSFNPLCVWFNCIPSSIIAADHKLALTKLENRIPPLLSSYP